MLKKLPDMRNKYKILFVYFSLFKDDNKINDFYSMMFLLRDDDILHYIDFFEILVCYIDINLQIQEEILYEISEEECIKEDAIHRLKVVITNHNLKYFVNSLLTEFDELKNFNCENIKMYEMTVNDFNIIFKNKLEIFDIFRLREIYYNFIKKVNNHH